MILAETPYVGKWKLPSDGLETPWKDAFQSMKEVSFPGVVVYADTDVYLEMFNDTRKGLFALREFEWQLKLHWIFKLRWNTKHKVPYRQNPKTQKAFRIEAEWLCTIRDLCVGCHAELQPKDTPYGNAALWFSHIINEFKFFAFEAIINNKLGTPGYIGVQEQREILRDLKQWINRFDVEDCPHFGMLIEKSLKLAGNSGGDVFAKKYWKPFLASYSIWINEQDSNPTLKSVLIKDGVAYYREGHGQEIFPLSRIQPLLF